LANKWAMLVLIRVSPDALRFNELKREVEGISQKVLTQTLRQLQRNGLVTRTAYPTVPVTVSYRSTPLGMSLVLILENLRIWSIDNIGSIQQAQTLFDATSGASIVESLARFAPK
jgi:DNA-binding HxlR family transcriptional regulator